MVSRIARVCFFMFTRMLRYVALGLIRPASRGRVLDRDYRAWAAYTLRTFDANLEVEGKDNLPPEDTRPLVVVSNHQSQLDIPALIAATGRRMGFVAKKELASVPLLSYWMRQIGCVVIDRSDRAGSHRALESAARGMGAIPLVVFPEGTRSKEGRLLPIKMGAFRLGLLAKARILPIRIQGTRDAGENRRKGKADAGIPVRMRIFPALDAGGMQDGKASLVAIKDYVEACLRTEGESDDPPLPAAAAPSKTRSNANPYSPL